MQCFVYKSTRKADTYVYLRARDDFALLPAAISEPLGPLTFVMQFELTAERKLARESAALVISNLHACGFHLQLPPPVESPLAAGDS
jgi:uncharacterized protein YcgL (UPF0745 family)